MFSGKDFEDRVFQVNNADFADLALDLFQFQFEHNLVYRSYVELLGISPFSVKKLQDIPFLPIQFFKTHQVVCGFQDPEVIFESSGTTQNLPSRHLVLRASLYRNSFRLGFERFYGPAEEWVILGLLPNYLERKQSSLVYMVNDLILLGGRPESGFYLYEEEKLFRQLAQLEKIRQKTLLIGVTFGLLDFVENYSFTLEHTLVMETGGMKGRRREQTREEVHSILQERLGIAQVHSEYGMTELLSQAYSNGKGIFRSPPWMRVGVRDEFDPLEHRFKGQSTGGDSEVYSGGINIIDLANIYSCSFIATEDIGKLHPDGGFEILGRMDNSAWRGCSLMIT
ncbi:MAG: LuxE/PaaK family acyltransferase [Chitinophagaceae bacterium]